MTTGVLDLALPYDFGATGQVPASRVQEALTLIRGKVNEIKSSLLDGAFRSDNTIADQVIRLRNLHPEVLAALGTTLTVSGGADAGVAAAAAAATFSVKSYGAKGDGVTDDTAAIQACFEAAESWRALMPTDSHSASGSGVLVFFPAGTYKLTSFLDWKAQSVMGEGSAMSRIIGAPGYDILRASTLNLGGQTARPRGFIGRLALVLDDSVDGRVIAGQTDRSWHNVGSTETGQVGAACIALDESDRNQNTTRFALYLWRFDDLICECRALTPNGQFGTAGIFTRRFVYGTTATHVKIRRLVYGYWEDFTDTNLATVTAANDENLWENLHIELCAYGMRLINNEETVLLKPHFYFCGTRPLWITSCHDLSRQNSYSVHVWQLHNENGAGVIRIEGEQHLWFAAATTPASNVDINIQCNHSRFLFPEFFPNGSGKVRVSGNFNVFTGIRGHSVADYVDTGIQNQFDWQFLTSGDAAIGIDYLGRNRSRTLNSPDAMGVRDGQAGGADYHSGFDVGRIDPADVYEASLAALWTCVQDATAFYGRYSEKASPGSWTFNKLGFSTNKLLVGTHLPAGWCTVYVALRAPDLIAGDTQTLKVMIDGTDSATSVNVALSTGWAVYKMDVDLSSYGGREVWVLGNIPRNAGNTADSDQRIQIGWIGFRPAQKHIVLQDHIVVPVSGQVFTYFSGDPNSAVSAVQGSLGLRTDFFDRVSAYVKMRAGNIGWEKIVTALRTESGNLGELCQIGLSGDVSTFFRASTQVTGRLACGYRWATNGSDRYSLDILSNPESGSNAGSPLALTAYSDGGSSLGQIWKCNRAVGGLWNLFRPTQIDAGDINNSQPALKVTGNFLASARSLVDFVLTDVSGPTDSYMVRYLTDSGGTSLWVLDKSGRVYHKPPGTLPVDAQIMAGGYSAWLDETGNALTFRVRYADGTTYKTGTLALV